MNRNNQILKILVLAPTPPPYHGSNYMVWLWLHSAIAEEFDVKHIRIQFSQNIEGLQRFTPKKGLLFAKYFLQLVARCISYRPDYVLMVPAFAKNPFIVTYFYAFVSRIILRRKIILWVHSNNVRQSYDRGNILLRRWTRNIFALSSLVVPVADSLAKSNYNFFSSPDKLRTIHNGIPVEVSERATATEGIQVTFLSNMDVNKGWKLLYDAAELLCRDIREVRFAFYGSSTNNSPEREIIQQFESSPYKDRIRYFGPIYGKAKATVLSETDIFCFPSFNEAFPLVNLEALAYGLPIVATDVGGIPEEVIDGKGGFLIEQGRLSGLVESLRKLITDGELRKQMGEFNRLWYWRNFTQERFVEEWLRLLRGNN